MMQACEVITQAVQCDPDSPYGHFLSFKLSVLQSHEDRGDYIILTSPALASPSTAALQALKAMVECTEDRDVVSGLVCLAAQMAFEVSRLVSVV